MPQQAFPVEHRLSELQAQIDRLSHTLQQWRQTQEHLQPMEQRLSQLTDRCAEMLNRWAATGERQTNAVGELEARLTHWNELEARLQNDAHQRMRELERAIEQEWKGFRELHGEPAKQFREQATALSETCVAAANLAVSGFERAEARIAALEADLQSRLAQLSRTVESAVAELRAAAQPQPAPLGGVAPFPLESVMRIHEELREASGGQRGRSGSLAPKDAPQLPEAAAALSQRLESLERAVTAGKEEVKETATRTDGVRRVSRAALIGLLVALVIGGVLWARLQRQVDAKLAEAAARVAAAERHAEATSAAATQQIASTREEAGREIAQARETAEQAQLVSSVLAAPDLVRYPVSGGEAAPRAFGMLLWSRSRGMVFSASRLPAAQDGTYQLWLVTASTPVSGGLLEPDSAGRVTLATDTPPNVPRPVIGAAVTLEPSGGREAPSGATVLSRVQ